MAGGQFQDSARAGHNSAADTACARRRSDRMKRRYPSKAEMTKNVLGLNAVGLLLASLMVGLVLATDLSKPETSSTNPVEKSIFVAPDASCVVWTDGCRNCTKDGCSNIGIACQPGEVRCLSRPSQQGD